MRWIYSARLTKKGLEVLAETGKIDSSHTVVDFLRVDPSSLPPGVPSFETRREAVADYRAQRKAFAD